MYTLNGTIEFEFEALMWIVYYNSIMIVETLCAEGGYKEKGKFFEIEGNRCPKKKREKDWVH